MELTTRCPECETVFTVSLAQLQLRKGYIRCVQCAHIFDGFEAVVPSSGSVPPAQATAAARSAPGPSQSAPSSSGPYIGPLAEPAQRDTSAAQTEPDSLAMKPFIIPRADRIPAQASGTSQAFSIGSPRGSLEPASGKEPIVGKGPLPPEPSVPYVAGNASTSVASDVREPRLPSVLRERGAKPSDRGEPVLVSTTAASAQDLESAEDNAGDFLFIEPRVTNRSDRRRAAPFADDRRAARWIAPIWAVLALCGVVLLLAQGAYVYRTQLANTFPGLRPTLEAACAQLSCAVPYERRLDAIAITGSALRASAALDEASEAATAADASQLTLEVTLRNTYERPQEWPTLVLDLKDASGAIVVRRNLPPPVWVPAALRDGPFPAGADLTVQVPLTVQGVQANGYQLDKFFP